MWESAWFNAAVLILLASNLVFIVQEVENRDADMAPFFRRVNIVYTVASPPPLQPHQRTARKG